MVVIIEPRHANGRQPAAIANPASKPPETRQRPPVRGEPRGPDRIPETIRRRHSTKAYLKSTPPNTRGVIEVGFGSLNAFEQRGCPLNLHLDSAPSS